MMISIRPQAVVSSVNTDFEPHQPSLRGFLRVCQDFNFEKDGWFGEDLCRGSNPVIVDSSTRSSRTIRFAGLPGDNVLVLFDADGTRGVDFGSLDESNQFNIWHKGEAGYNRIDDINGSMENPRNWISGDFFALITDETHRLVEVVVWDGFSNPSSIQSGAQIDRFRYDRPKEILELDTSIIYRTNRNGDGSDRDGLPNILEVCIEYSRGSERSC